MFRKLWRSHFGKTNEQRRISSPGDLTSGDLITFKHRLVLPPSLQGQTFEISSVAAYEYDDGLYPQLTLDGPNGDRIFLVFKETSPNQLYLSRVAPRSDVLNIFDEQEFATLWEEDFAEISLVNRLPEYDGWLGDRYTQTKKSAEGYYHDRDCRGKEISDNEGEELRYHECEDGSSQFGMSVEIYGDGETEVSLEVHCNSDVIESMWPGEGSRKS